MVLMVCQPTANGGGRATCSRTPASGSADEGTIGRNRVPAGDAFILVAATPLGGESSGTPVASVHDAATSVSAGIG